MAALSEFAQINPRLETALDDQDSVSFLGMADVSEHGITSSGVDRPFSEVKKGYTPFARGDLLVAKITPCFENGKIAQASISRARGFGSTEFHVVRPDLARAEPRFILHALRSPAVRAAGELRMTGSAGQRRVPKEFLESLDIPLPPLPEQRRIASILDSAHRTIQLRTTSSGSLEAALRSAMDIAHRRASSTVSLGDCATIEARLVDPRNSEYCDYPLIAPDNIESGSGRLRAVRTVGEVAPKSGKYLFAPGEVLYSKIRPLLNKAALATSHGLCSADVYPLRVREDVVRPEYLWAELRSARFLEFSGTMSNRAQMPKLNREQLFSYEMPIPTLDVQDEFVDFSRDVASLLSRTSEHLAKLDELFASLQHRAFRGEL